MWVRSAADRSVSLNKQAWIDEGNGTPWRPCMVDLISRNSVVLRALDGKPVPPEFTLHFTASGMPMRRCSAVQFVGGWAYVQMPDDQPLKLDARQMTAEPERCVRKQRDALARANWRWRTAV